MVKICTIAGIQVPKINKQKVAQETEKKQMRQRIQPGVDEESPKSKAEEDKDKKLKRKMNVQKEGA